ncbi:MAG: hypothetical protein PUC52_07110 [bacterium]|nr:hypothetical protein [bacterium]
MNALWKRERQEERRRRVRAAALLVLLMALWGVLLWQRPLRQESREAVERAVRRSMGQCYAVEGVYPAELSYLEEHYGLTINHRRYIVTYEAFASNLTPEVQVLPRGGGN